MLGFFSDNSAFLRSSISINNREIQIDLNNLAHWGVKLSKSNTVGIILNGNIRNCTSSNIKFKLVLNNDILNQVNKVRFLGLIFDQNLQFKSHIDSLVEPCKNILMSLDCWGY